jgi:hypothetical protein
LSKALSHIQAGALFPPRSTTSPTITQLGCWN